MDGNVNYVVVGSRPWNRRIFNEFRNKLRGKWHYIGDKDALRAEDINLLKPRYIFFLHWSWRVPSIITDQYECVCFHMTDVPFGRGGSPLQNLVERGHRSTKLTALKMVQNIDAGPVYLKKDLSLEGNAEEIYMRATFLSFQMINEIIKKQIEPVPQKGAPTFFDRRNPNDSELQDLKSLSELYDFIRMLDCEGYSKAFILYKGFRFEFRRAGLYDRCIVADVKITTMKENE